MQITRTMNVQKLLPLVLSVGLFGCSQPMAVPDVIADTGPAIDTGPDTGPDRCGQALPTLFGAPIVSTDMMAATPTQTGGAIADGVYYLTAVTRYTEAMRPQTFDRATLRISGEFWDFSFGMNGTLLATSRYRRASSTGSTVMLTGRCETTSSLDVNYTASGTTMLRMLFAGTDGIELTFATR